MGVDVVSPGDLQVFLARVRRHAGRVDQLADLPGADPRDGFVAALSELEMMYEDLLVAEEELRVQGEELSAARSALNDSQLRYQELFDSTPVALLVTTADGAVLEANRAATELLGLSPRAAVGKPLAAYVELPSRPALRRAMTHVGRGGSRATVDLVLRPRQGRPVRSRATLDGSTNLRRGEIELRWTLGPAAGAADAGNPVRA